MSAESPAPGIDGARDDLIRVLPEASTYIEEFAPNMPLVIIKAGGDIIKDADHLSHLVGSVDHLRRLGFPAVVVHGGGAQIDEAYRQHGLPRKKLNGLGVTSDEGIGLAYGALLGANELIASKMRPDTFVQFPLVAKTSLINYEKYGWVGDPSLDRQAQREIREALQDGKVPIVASLGKVAVWDGVSDSTIDIATNVNGDDLARELVATLKPHKYVALTGTGGVLDTQGKMISYLHPEQALHLIEDGTINRGMAKKIQEMLKLFENSEINDIVIALPQNLIRELFTHEGAGTLLTRDQELARYEIGNFNEEKVRNIIETAFSNGDYFARLADDYFDLDDISHILLTPQKYGAVGVVRSRDAFHYLCKIAAIPEFRGRGLSADIIDQATNHAQADENKPLLWRARIEDSDPVNVALRLSYAKKSDYQNQITSDDGHQWMVYARNTDNMDKEELDEAERWIANQPSTITRIPAKAR